MKGKIHRIEGKSVFIAAEETECFGCMAQECRGKPRLVEAENNRGLDLSVGQLVESGGAPSFLFRQMLAAFAPPLAGFALGFLLTAALFPASGNAWRTAAGFALLVAAAAFTYFYRKSRPAARLEVVRVLG
jgi:positive regulator of sigma E activity